jgi:hypothetical protein
VNQDVSQEKKNINMSIEDVDFGASRDKTQSHWVGMNKQATTRISDDHIDLLRDQRLLVPKDDEDISMSKKVDRIFLAQKLKMVFKHS